MSLVGRVAERHHECQLLRFFNAQQFGEGRLVDRAHDAAAHAFVPCGKGHVGKGDAGIGGKVAGDGSVLHHGHIQGGQLVGFGRALLRRQIGSPLDQRLHLCHRLGLVHHHQTHSLTVGSAGGQADGLDDIIYHILRNSFLCKAAVGAAADKSIHNRHKEHLLYISVVKSIADAAESCNAPAQKSLHVGQ